MKWLILILLMLVLVRVYARTPPSTTMDFDHYWTTADAAAIHGLRLCVAKSRTVEYAGGVFLWKGRYYISPPVSQQDDSRVVYTMRFPTTATIVATFHTHPLAPLSEWVSENDIKMAQKTKSTSYIGLIGHNTIIAFVPGVDKMEYVDKYDSSGVVIKGWVSRGHKVADLGEQK